MNFFNRSKIFKFENNDFLLICFFFYQQTTMFLVIVFVMVVMVAITVVLPQISGVARYTNNPDYDAKKREKRSSVKSEQPEIQSNVYRAPDEDFNSDNIDSAKVSGHNGRFGVRATIKKIVQTPITESDIPVKLEIVGEETLKRRVRGERSSGRAVTDPNSYDFNIDDFIEEENKRDEMERRNETLKMYGNADV